MSSLSKFRGDEFFEKIRSQYGQNLKAAGIHLSNEVKKNVSDPYPPASAPGDPAHRRTGHLRRSYTWEFDEETMTCRVGTNVIYGLYLEIGTASMDARPVLRPTLAKERRKIKAILNRKTDVR